MFICNFKVNGSKIFKVFFTGMTLLLIFILVFVTYKIFYGAKNNNKACMPQSDVFVIEPKNYTNVLKASHENIDNYVGKKINFTGYVYRVLDLKDNQFVLARNMLISEKYDYVVVGFLCEYDDIKSFKDGTWINVTGEIVKGDYHGDMPIVKVTEIKKCEAPQEEFVSPPDKTYIPTSTWI
ncbi:MAG: hypothetical protein IKF97_03825 [Clostridia bacterium]|nr:hypothetical protein [Clostridia bacterium]